MSSPGPIGFHPGNARPNGLLNRFEALVHLTHAVDSFPETAGAGIILIDPDGRRTEVRGGPRRKWVWIGPRDKLDEALPRTPPEPSAFNRFWDRWGSTVLNCGSAGATILVIKFSAGTTAPLVGALAVNSALLCGTSIGKAVAYDAWQDFERHGGTAYTAWLTTETILSLLDLFNGGYGAVKFLKEWKAAGKLDKLARAVSGKSLQRPQLLQAIREVDPQEAARIDLKARPYVSRRNLIGVGEGVLRRSGFVSLSAHRRNLIIEAFGNALTLAGTRDSIQGAIRTGQAWGLSSPPARTHPIDIYLIQIE